MAKKMAVIGGGWRGTAYAEYARDYPDELEIVAVAEPNAERRGIFAGLYGLREDQTYADWRDLLAKGQLADGVAICTPDFLHREPVELALKAGYQVLLEKPLATTLDDTVGVYQAAMAASEQFVQVCHVLRYTPFFRKLHEIVHSGGLGDLVHITHSETIIFSHIAHAFVRGNWRSTQYAAPMIVAKCCHDLDILYWMLGSPVTQLSSFGSLKHFRAENAPEGATLRCTDNCPAADVCKYYAPRLYGTDAAGWPYDVVSPERSVEARLKALETGPYGRCVYHCDNDVVDHQVVNMATESGVTVSLVMHGFSAEDCRTMRYDGTDATLFGKFGNQGAHMTIHHHRSGEVEEVHLGESDLGHHGGGDTGIMRSFVRAMNGEFDPHLTTVAESIESHLLGFAAEESRLSNKMIDMAAFRAQHVEKASSN